MALIVSAASGNFNAGATWVGGVVPTTGDEAQAATGHTITITANTTCNEISNAGTGKFVINNNVTLTANVTVKTTSTNGLGLLIFSSSGIANVVGNCTANNIQNNYPVQNTGTGTINITGNCSANGPYCTAVQNSSTGVVNIVGNVTGGNNNTQSYGVRNTSSGSINITGNVTAGTQLTAYGAANESTGTLSIIGTITATQFAAGVFGSNVLQQTILSGPFITETTRGVNPVYCAAWRWNASPSNSTYMEVMTNNLLAKRNLVTADNITGMPAASNVKSGIAYGPSNELTGTFSQTVTPSVSDIATAVWGAATRTITGGTVDTLTNAPASVTPTDIWSHSSRTLTSASGPTAVQIRQEMDSNSTKLANLDSTVSSRLAGSAYTAPSTPPTAIQIRQELDANSTKLDVAVSSRLAASEASKLDAVKAKTDALNTERLANVATTAIVGNLIAQANS